MKTKSTFLPQRLGLRGLSLARALPVILMFAVLAVADRATANPFAATTVSPHNQTVAVGDSSSFNLNFAVGTASAFGIDAWLTFDPTKIQILSITTGASSPFTTVGINTFDNVAGTFEYAATGGSTRSTFTAATIDFLAIGPGTSAIQFSNVNEDIVGSGPFGVKGLAVDGSVTVTGSAAGSVPDSGATAAMLGSALLALAVLRRRFASA